MTAKLFPVNSRILIALLFIYAFALLSIGLTKEWRLVHEDNSAALTSLALTHLHLGYKETRFHNFYYDYKNDTKGIYANHPPGTALLLSATIALLNNHDPWVARMTAIVFHLGSLALMMWLLSRFFPLPYVLLGGFLMATLPMGSFFGRMLNFESGALFSVFLQFAAYIHYRLYNRKISLVVLCLAIWMGGIFDWIPFFFSLGIFIIECLDWMRDRTTFLGIVLIGASGLGIFIFNLWHAHLAMERSWQGIMDWLMHVKFEGEREKNLFKIAGAQLEFFRRYFSHVGLLATLAILAALIFNKKSWSLSLLEAPHQSLLRSLLWAWFIGTYAYMVLMMSWAKDHHYLQIYIFPFVIFSMVFLARFLIEKTNWKKGLRFSLISVLVLDIFCVTVYTLVRRHTREGVYAVRKTAELKAAFLNGNFKKHS